MMSEPRSAVSVYNTIFENLLPGNHTLILTEYRHDVAGEPFFLDPASVFRMLWMQKRIRKNQIVSSDTFAVVASRVGMADQRISSGKLGRLQRSILARPPLCDSHWIPAFHRVRSDCGIDGEHRWAGTQFAKRQKDLHRKW